MRIVLLVLGLVLLGAAAGAAAVSVPFAYNDFACEGDYAFQDWPWQWWPLGHDCPADAYRPGAPSVAGAAVGTVAGALVALVGWRLRARAWARAAVAATLSLGTLGLVGAAFGYPFALLVAAAVAPVGAYATDRGLRGEGGDRLRSAVRAILVPGAALSIAVVFTSPGEWAWYPPALIGAVAAGAGISWALDRINEGLQVDGVA